MMRWCLIILFFPLAGWSQKFSTADLRLLKAYSTGVFSNDQQVKNGDHSVQPALKVQPLWQARKDGIWLFAEKTDSVHRYQVWHFYRQDDTTVLMQFLDFKSNQQALQLSQDIKQQSTLYLSNLLVRHGCELYLGKNKMQYAAISSGKDCLADRAGAEYTSYNIRFEKNRVLWQETSFDKDDKLLTDESYNFIKQVKSLK